MADSDDGNRSQRDSHYNLQRSSLRSDRSLHSPSRPQSSWLRSTPSSNEDYTLPDNYGNLNEVAVPSPVENPHEAHVYRHHSLEEEDTRPRAKSGGSRSMRRWSTRGERRPRRGSAADEYTFHSGYNNLNEVTGPSPIENPHEYDLYRHSTLEDERTPSSSRRGQRSRSSWLPLHSPLGTSRRNTDFSMTALPPIPDHQRSQDLPRDPNSSEEFAAAKPTPHGQRASRLATELYTISYLIFFSILGTLARLGLQWLTFYPGAPVTFSELWANVGGTLFMGFLAEDRRLFMDEWGKDMSKGNANQLNTPNSADEEKATQLTRTKSSHARVKKTIPLYIGLATGFCGSFTSFSSFMRDVFFALSNTLPSPVNHPSPSGTSISTSSTVNRNGGYSFMAVLAVLFITIALSYVALKVGAHIAILLDPLTPTISFYLLRKILDRFVVVAAWGAWAGAIIMAIFPPDRPDGPQSKGTWTHETWRGQAVFACVFAPIGCLMRFYLSLKLNGIVPSFPLGTFCVNIFGTAVLGMAYDLQHVRLGYTGVAGGSRVACQALQGVMDGFCGCLTTVSTWIGEVNGLRRGHAYIYGGMSVACGLGLLVAIMGTVKWTVGWTEVVCVV